MHLHLTGIYSHIQCIHNYCVCHNHFIFYVYVSDGAYILTVKTNNMAMQGATLLTYSG